MKQAVRSAMRESSPDFKVDEIFFDRVANLLQWPSALVRKYRKRIMAIRESLVPLVQFEEFVLIRGDQTTITGEELFGKMTEVMRAASGEEELDSNAVLERVSSELKLDGEALSVHKTMFAEILLRARSALTSDRIPDFLFEGGPVSRTCLAAVQVDKPGRAVLCQCVNSRLPHQGFCKMHLQERSRKFGHWDVATGSVVGAAVRELERARAKAQFKVAANIFEALKELPVLRSEELRDGMPIARPKAVQPSFVECGDRVGQERLFPIDGVSLPPFPCLLCDKNFGCQAHFLAHVDDAHCGMSEYRKRLFWLAKHGGRPVRPTEWRHIVEAFSENFVTGSADWPACRIETADLPQRQSWWKRFDSEDVPLALKTLGFGANLDALGPSPCKHAECVSTDGARACEPECRGTARRAVRCRIACAACARLGWETDYSYEHFWRNPKGSFLDGNHRSSVDGARLLSRRQTVAAFLSPERYHERWRFRVRCLSPDDTVMGNGADAATIAGGIPLDELRRSSVRDPEDRNCYWLLHRRVFSSDHEGVS